ncbi:hypothetical protein MBLNU13_g06574t2 [Cladosporium sp. NU13]
MATTRTLFLPDDPTTWTAEAMRTHLRTGRMKDAFYKEIFGWSDAELRDAIQQERLAQAALVHEGYDVWWKGGRDCVRFPTITQKFFQYARECRRESLKRETSVETGVTEKETTTSRTISSPDLTKKRSASPLSSNGKVPRTSLDGERYSPATANETQHDDKPARPTPQPNNAVIHVGPEQLQYNYDDIRRSLRMADDSQLKLFWFEYIAGEPWIVKDDHAIPGAIERMHARGKICFLLATDIEHVRALTLNQRQIENQTVQTLTLDLSPAETPDQQDETPHDTFYFHPGRHGRRMAKPPCIIPSISVSLARILGEEVMKSRIE